MSGLNEKKGLPYWAGLLITLGIQAVVSLIFVWTKGLFSGTYSGSEAFKLLSDAFFVPGVLVFCFGVLFWASQEGAFDGLAWSMGSFLRMLIPGGGLKKRESYGDYLERKRGDRKKLNVSFVMLGGAIFMIIAGVFVIIFEKLDVVAK